MGVNVIVGVIVDRTVTVRVVLFCNVVLGTGDTEVAPYLVLQTSPVKVRPWAGQKERKQAKDRQNKPVNNMIS